MARSAIYPPSVQPGKPRLGFPPRGWCTVTFSDLFEVIERPAVLDDSKEYQLITAKRSRGGIVPRERLRGKDILTKTQFYVSEGDFLISNRQIIHGGCGIVPPALDGAIVSNEYTVLRPRPILRPDFLSYLPHSIYFQQTCFHASVGVDVEKMVFDVDHWLKFKIHLPPVSEQASIAELLLGVDNAIQATLAVIQQTRKVKQGVLDGLLTKGIGHSRFIETEIGAIPETWRLTTLGELCSLTNGNGFRPPDWTDNGLPIIRIQNLNGSREFNHFAGTPKPKWIVEPGDLLFSWAGVRGVSFGPCIWDGPRGVLNQHIFKVHPSPDVNKFWLYHSMRMATARIEAKAHGFKASLLHVHKSEITGQLVALPPESEQEEVVQRLNALSQSEQCSKDTLAQLEKTKSALLSDLLIGRKRVSADALSPAL